MLAVLSISLGTVTAVQSAPLSAHGQFRLDVIIALLQLIRANFDGIVDFTAIMQGALRGMVESLRDPYSAYYDPVQLHDLLESVEGRFGGIGVVIEVIDGAVTVVTPLAGTPAVAAGLLPADIILSVDGRNLTGMTLPQVSRLIRGEPGTTVRLTIFRPSTGERFDVELTRALIAPSALEVKELGQGMYYISISQFTEETGRSFAIIARHLAASGNGVVLDLRNNPGGLLNSTLEATGALVPAGPLLHVVRLDGDQITFFGQGAGLDLPLVVLINEGTASGAEIVAAAVQDYGTGVLVGTPSFGKGTVQDIFLLEDQGGVKLTVARFLTPKGHPMEGKGVTPDIHVEGPPPVPIPLLPVAVVDSASPAHRVAPLQQALRMLGHYHGAMHGIYDDETRRAVCLYQEVNDLPVTGIMDTDALVRLNVELVANSGDAQLIRAIGILRQLMDR